MLKPDECKIVKQITIVSPHTRHGEISIGYFLYERPMTPTYKYNHKPKEERQIDYLLTYPLQENFPTDQIDKIILQSVKDIYPKSFARSYEVYSTFDIERTERLVNRPFKNGMIMIGPCFADVDVYSLTKNEFEALNKPIKVYADYSSEIIENYYFNGYYPLNDETILDEIDKIIFL